MPYNVKRVPDIVRLGSQEHTTAVKNLFRRACKIVKPLSQYRYERWDWYCLHIREEFEKGKSMKDAGEILQTMKDLEEYLNFVSVRQNQVLHPWDGPGALAFNRYPPQPMKAFEPRVEQLAYDCWWNESRTDEWFAKKEIDKWRGRYITIFRDLTLKIKDYPTWLYLKKRLESELKYMGEFVQSQMNVSLFTWAMEYPYNVINEFSDGYKPDYTLDIAFHDHWDEDLWKHVASLDYEEKEYPKLHDFGRSYKESPIHSHGRFIPN